MLGYFSPLRRLLAVIFGVVALALFDAAVELVVRRAGLRFPSSVAGMLLCFAAFVVFRRLAPKGAERAARALAPAAGFLGRWMALFFVPPLVLLPLAEPPSAGDLARLAVLLILGFAALLLVTAFVARALGAPEHARLAGGRTPSRGLPRLAVLACWGLLAAVALPAGTTHAAPRLVFGVSLSVVCFVAADWLRSGFAAGRVTWPAIVLHPVLVGAFGIHAAWSALGLPLREFLTRSGSALAGPGDCLMALLSPAVVALGLALDAERRLLREGALPLLLSTVFAAAFSLFATALAARALGLSALYARALLPRSVTTPVALSIAELLDAEPGLTAVFVISSGVLGALFAAPLLDRAGFRAPFVIGVATGASSHGIGTAALLREKPAAAALSGISFALTAAASVSLVSLPWVRSALLRIVG